MTLTETNLNEKAEQILDFVNSRLKEAYETKQINGMKKFYKQKYDVYFDVNVIFFKPVDPAVIVEYAHGIEDAKHYRFEDGDSFFLSDYEDAESLYMDLLEEIEESGEQRE